MSIGEIVYTVTMGGIVVAILWWLVADMLRVRPWRRRTTCKECAEYRRPSGGRYAECHGAKEAWVWHPLEGVRLVRGNRDPILDNSEGRCMGFVPKGKGGE